MSRNGAPRPSRIDQSSEPRTVTGTGTSTTSKVVEVVEGVGVGAEVVGLGLVVPSTVVGGLFKSANVRSGASEPLPEHADRMRMRTRSFRISFGPVRTLRQLRSSPEGFTESGCHWDTRTPGPDLREANGLSDRRGSSVASSRGKEHTALSTRLAPSSYRTGVSHARCGRPRPPPSSLRESARRRFS